MAFVTERGTGNTTFRVIPSGGMKTSLNLLVPNAFNPGMATANVPTVTIPMTKQMPLSCWRNGGATFLLRLSSSWQILSRLNNLLVGVNRHHSCKSPSG